MELNNDQYTANLLLGGLLSSSPFERQSYAVSEKINAEMEPHQPYISGYL
ncbi:hypothetical protein KIN_44500 [Litoreibacter roseus]|uniref:Uncharacterized protein n=1 Tax=Litoreibacter roseus TaxID=2601869 RepID=A0A6N6JM50_9RHOB|nr:hypothetical protein KIN_44500 [Litoreibacter roseus]